MLKRQTLFELVESLSMSEERKSPPKGYPKDKSQYAYPEEWMFPVDTKHRCESAVRLFPHHKFPDVATKKKVAKRILKACKEHDVEVSENTEVYKAAHS